MSKILEVIGAALIVIAVIAFGYTWMFADGKIQAKYNNTVGIEVKDSQRNVYEHSATYVEAKVQELSKYRLELSKTKDAVARKAIIDTLLSDCANLDTNDINDKSIKQFLQQLRTGELN